MPDNGPGPIQVGIMLWMLNRQEPSTVRMVKEQAECVKHHKEIVQTHVIMNKLYARAFIFGQVREYSTARHYGLTPKGLGFLRYKFPDLFEPQEPSVPPPPPESSGDSN